MLNTKFLEKITNIKTELMACSSNYSWEFQKDCGCRRGTQKYLKS